jgi:hypothetical protein
MRFSLFSTISVLFLFVGLVACGGGNSSPSAPSSPVVTTQSIVVAMSSPMAAGSSAQATAVATLSSGSTQAITSGFRSDVPSVATVTDSGMVTAVSLGSANIYVVSGGQQGTKNIRVVPNYAGDWSGSYYVTDCSQTGDFATYLDYCTSDFTKNSVWPYNLSLTQSLDTVTGTCYLGSLPFGQSSGTMDGAGGVTLSSSYYSDPLTIYGLWNLSSPTPGRLSGTVRHRWVASGYSGQLIVTGTVRDSMKMNGAMPRTDHRIENIISRWHEVVRR